MNSNELEGYELMFDKQFYCADFELEDIRCWSDENKVKVTKGRKVSKSKFQNIWRSVINHLLQTGEVECRFDNEFCVEGCIYFVMLLRHKEGGFTSYFCVDNGEGVYIVSKSVYDYYYDMSLFKNNRRVDFDRLPVFNGDIYADREIV